jgi:PKD repeat protein
MKKILLISLALIVMISSTVFGQAESFIFPVKSDEVSNILDNTINPCSTAGGWYVNNDFGTNWNNTFEGTSPGGVNYPYHPGMDYNRSDGEENSGNDVPVYSIADGTVIRVKDMGDDGWAILVRYDLPSTEDLSSHVISGTNPTNAIQNASSIVAMYFHLYNNALGLSSGDHRPPSPTITVIKGQLLGYISSSLAHLHFEIRAGSNDQTAAVNSHQVAGYYDSTQSITDFGNIDPEAFIEGHVGSISPSIVGLFGPGDRRDPASAAIIQKFGDMVRAEHPLGDPWDNGGSAYVHPVSDFQVQQDFIESPGQDNGFSMPWSTITYFNDPWNYQVGRLLKEGFWATYMNPSEAEGGYGWISLGVPVTNEMPENPMPGEKVKQRFWRLGDNYANNPSDRETRYLEWDPASSTITPLDENSNPMTWAQLTVESGFSPSSMVSLLSNEQTMDRDSPPDKSQDQSGGGSTKAESKIKFNDKAVIATTSQPDGIYYSDIKVADFGQPLNLIDLQDYSGFYAVLGGGVIPIDPFNMDGDQVIYIDSAPPGAELVFDYWYINPNPGTVGELLHVEGGISNIGASSITIPEVRIELLNPNGTEFYHYSEYNVYLESGWQWSQWLYGNPHSVGNHTARFRLYMDDQWQTYATQTVYVESNPIYPVADFSASPISGHSPLTVQFTDQSTGEPYDFAWTFGDGGSSTEQNPIHTYTQPGSYAVALAVYNGTGTDGEMKYNFITVNESLVADFSANNTSISAGQLVSFTDMSIGGPTSWQWDFGDGTIITTYDGALNHVYMDPGVYTVTLTVSSHTGADVESKVDYITVGESELSFTADVVSGTVPLTVNFAGAAPGTPDSWCWDLGDGSISIIDPDIPCAQFITHTYEEPGVYDVQLAVAYGDGSTIHIIYESFITVVGSFAANVTEGLAPLTVQFSDQSGVDASSWQWDFGDGNMSTSQNPSHNYDSPGRYTVTFVAGSGPGAVTMTRVDYINVVDSVMGFTADVTYGLGPLAVNFNNFSLGDPVFWGWSFGDGAESIDQHPNHTYQNPGVYTVTLYAFHGSHTDTLVYEDYITVVDELLNTNFSSDVTTGVGPLTVQFTDQSTGNPTSWVWTFGDGGTSAEQNPSHEYTTPGVYDVLLTASNGVSDDTLLRNDYIAVEDNLSGVGEDFNVFALHTNHPNPFNPQTTISYSLPSSQRVRLDIYDVTGRMITTLVDGILEQGSHTALWNGRNTQGQVVSSGVYFYRLTTASDSSTRKMLLMK